MAWAMVNEAQAGDRSMHVEIVCFFTARLTFGELWLEEASRHTVVRGWVAKYRLPIVANTAEARRTDST